MTEGAREAGLKLVLISPEIYVGTGWCPLSSPLMMSEVNKRSLVGINDN